MAEIDLGTSESSRCKEAKLPIIIMVALVAAVLFVSSLSLLPYPSSETPPASVPARTSYTSHAPISINGNAEFNKTNFPLNGVASGNGTASNPYIIEGWDINASTSTGIRVYNTNVHFIIRNCYVHDGSVIYNGIDIVSCSNVSLLSNNCSKNYNGIDIVSCSNVSLLSNNCSENMNGLSSRLCSNGLLLDNMLRFNLGRGAYLNQSSHFIVSNNTCSNSYEGITIDRSDNITIRNNTCRMMNNYGIYLERSNRIELIGNNCSSNDYGIFVDWSKNCSISFNNCSENGLGVYLYLSGISNVVASNNTISENTLYGMYIIFSRGNIFTNNTVALNNIYGICIMFSINNTFSYNLVAYTTGIGMYLDSFSSYNRICSNTLINNNGASSVYNTSHIQAYDYGTNNWWNASGTPHGYGNYWGNWITPDANTDGIVDNPYNISGSAGAKDYYPLTTAPVPYDSLPPTTSISLSGVSGLCDWYLSDVTVTLTALDVESGVNYTRYRIDGGSWVTYMAPFVISTEGNYTLEYYSIDLAGNPETPKSAQVKIDHTAPTTSDLLSGTMGANSWYITDVNVSLTVIDAHSDSNSTTYRINGGSWLTYTAPFVISSQGNHTLEFYSVDLAGNIESTHSANIKIDKTAPTATASGYMYNVTLSASDNAGGSGVDRIMYRIDSGIWQTYSVPFSAGATGSYNVTFYAVDNAGNVESTKWIMTPIADTAEPSTSVAVDGTLGSNGWYNSSVTVTLTATDDAGGSGVNYTKYRINGSAWLMYSTPIVLSTDGSYIIEFNSTDDSGNIEATKSIAVKIDKAAPTSAASRSGSTVTLSSSDATSGVNKTLYRINNGPWLTYTAPFDVTAAGNNTIEYYSIDEAGNAESVKTTYVDNGGGGGGMDLFGLVMAILIIAILVAIGIPAILGMRRRAKESDSKSAIKDIGTSVAQMEDDVPKDPGKK